MNSNKQKQNQELTKTGFGNAIFGNGNIGFLCFRKHNDVERPFKRSFSFPEPKIRVYAMSNPVEPLCWLWERTLGTHHVFPNKINFSRSHSQIPNLGIPNVRRVKLLISLHSSFPIPKTRSQSKLLNLILKRFPTYSLYYV
jgi:hypothetical protein